MKNYYLIAIISCFLFRFLHGNSIKETDNTSLFELAEDTLFVSLGSTCEAAHILKNCGIRKAAFPFDWITTLDSERFLQILEDDFYFFLDENFLSTVPLGVLLNDYYHVEFIHDGDFRADTTMPSFQSKYQRRIKRFRELNQYPGKVYFLRHAFHGSTTDPYRYYHCADNLEISDDYAWRLYHLLHENFPQLNFTLIIINNDNSGELREEKRLAHNLIKIRSNVHLEASIKWGNFSKYFHSLMTESKVKSIN